MKVAIIGTVPLSKRVAPYSDPSWDIWVCSPGNSQGGTPPRITKWFELHAIVDMIGAENAAWCPAYFAWLAQQNFPIYMQERNEHVPAAIPFPRQELMKRWGESAKAGRTNWFTSSIAWMMAYAIYLGAEEIGIFGVDMAAAEEHYTMQKGGILRFVEIARAAGITVTIPLESTLSFGAPLYGYAEASRMGRSLITREHEMKAKLGELEATIQRLQQEACFFKGALEQIQFDRRTFVSGNEDAEVDFEAPEPDIAGTSDVHGFDTTTGGILVPSSSGVAQNKAPSATDFAGNPEAQALLTAPQPKTKRKGNGQFAHAVEG